MTFHCIASLHHCIAFHCTTLHYITLHYIALHTHFDYCRCESSRIIQSPLDFGPTTSTKQRHIASRDPCCWPLPEMARTWPGLWNYVKLCDIWCFYWAYPEGCDNKERSHDAIPSCVRFYARSSKPVPERGWLARRNPWKNSLKGQTQTIFLIHPSLLKFASSIEVIKENLAVSWNHQPTRPCRRGTDPPSSSPGSYPAPDHGDFISCTKGQAGHGWSGPVGTWDTSKTRNRGWEEGKLCDYCVFSCLMPSSIRIPKNHKENTNNTTTETAGTKKKRKKKWKERGGRKEEETKEEEEKQQP